MPLRDLVSVAMFRWSTWIALALLCAHRAPLIGVEAVLRAPLTTVVAVTAPVFEGDKEIRATVTVPADAPADLGVAAFVTDRHGRWYQRLQPGTLAPGTHELRFAMAGLEPLQAQDHHGVWNSAESAKTVRAGLLFWSASASRARLIVEGLQAKADAPPTRTEPTRLLDVTLGGVGADGAPAVAAGTRWSLTVRPQPFPANPYDRAEFSLDLVVSTPDGRDQRIPGFCLQPMRASDRGDREEVLPDGAATFAVRFRPRIPGAHRLRLEARWGKHGATVEHAVAFALPDLIATGAAWDDYVRVDAQDPRFFSCQGKVFWPLGPNLRSVWDLRSQQYLGTRVTPDRGTRSYHAYLDRLAANGANAIEVWMCSWNLALEWRGDWPGYFGQGRFSEENAWRLDQLLDDAYAHGMRVNLVINNHGQASDRTDKEWHNNPYNLEVGGVLKSALQLFSDPRALEGQERLRTYLVARYADHPAVLGWKLWSEINLTAGGQDQEVLRAWHEQATKRWHQLDTYGHGCTTHWAGDFRAANHAIVALPGIDYVCIDAYHGPAAEGGGMLLADLLARSTGEGRANGLSRFNKPVLVTEYGGNWSACPPPQMIAENACGPWAALVTGHGGAPMLWWFEWQDQGDHFAPYRALSRFISGEDLRGEQARAVALTATSPAGDLWARAWMRPGRMLGYVMDRNWGASGTATPLHEHAALATIAQIVAGHILIEWWNADEGTASPPISIEHPGGVLSLEPPPFARHIAFKLYRTQDG